MRKASEVAADVVETVYDPSTPNPIPIIEADRAELVEEIAAWVEQEAAQRISTEHGTYTLTGAATADAIREQFGKPEPEPAAGEEEP